MSSQATAAERHSALRVAGIALVLGLVVSGCSTLSSLNPFGGSGNDDKESEEPAELVDFEREANVRVVWDHSVGDGLGGKFIKLAPAIDKNRIFAADAYGAVVARELTSGKSIWQVEIGQPAGISWLNRLRPWARIDNSFVTGGVGVGDGIVLIGTTDGVVFALDDLTGAEVWRAEVGAEVLSAPATNGDIVAVNTADGLLHALERDSGESRWTYSTQLPVLTVRGNSRPVFVGQFLVAGFASGRLVALQPDNGQPIWEQRLAVPQGRSELERMVDIDGTPLSDGNVIYAASFQGKLQARDAQSGRSLWERNASAHQPLSIGQGQLYLVGKEDRLAAIDVGTTDVSWEVESMLRRGLSAPAVVGNYVLVGDAEGYLHVFAQSDGRLVARKRLDRSGLRGEMAVADGIVYALGNSGKLLAFRVERIGSDS